MRISKKINAAIKSEPQNSYSSPGCITLLLAAFHARYATIHRVRERSRKKGNKEVQNYILEPE